MLLSEGGGRGHAAIVELEDEVVVAAVGDRPVSGPHLESGSAHVDQEGRDQFPGAAGTGFFPGGGEQDDVVGEIGMADEVLGTVDEVAVAVPDRRAAHASQI